MATNLLCLNIAQYYQVLFRLLQSNTDQKMSNNGHEETENDDSISSELRCQYRQLMFETKEKRTEYVRPESTGLISTLDRVNELFTKVKNPREAAFDSGVLKLASELGSEQATNLQTNLTVFDPKVFCEKLVTFMGGRCNESRKRDLDWSKLGKVAVTMFNKTPKLDFIYGPLAMEPIIKHRASRERIIQKKPSESEKKKPHQLKQEEQEESTTKEVQRVFKAIYKLTDPEYGPYKHVSFYEFITDPNSFSATIENMFHLSFLVKDGKVRLYVDDEGYPVVRINANPDAVTNTPSVTRKLNPSQVVINITMQKWQDLINQFNITSPMIPRKSSETGTSRDT